MVGMELDMKGGEGREGMMIVRTGRTFSKRARGVEVLPLLRT